MAKRKRNLPPRGAHGRFIKRRGARKNDPDPARRKRKSARKSRSYARGNEPARRKTGKRSHKRNPFGLERIGLTTPTLTAVAFTSAGVIGTPLVEGFVAQLIPLPVDKTFNALARYAIKVGSAVVVGFAVGQIFGRDRGKAALVGGGAYILVDAIREFVPGMQLPAPSAAAGAYFPTRMGAQPLLGRYPSLGSAITYNAPERLQPESRF